LWAGVEKPPIAVFPSARGYGYHRNPKAEHQGMKGRGVIFAWCALLLAGSLSPAMAQDYWYGYWHHSPRWRAVDGGIYQLNNRIAFLEANPDIDDGYKGPIISRARRDIRKLNATLLPAQWEWPTPCCYGRRSIHIR
jgi:hypothetical protein